MQFTFWFIIVIMVILIVYQFMPSLQIFVDDKWSHVQEFRQLIDDDRFHIPADKQPTTADTGDVIHLTAQKWGDPSINGPDRSLAGECWWVDGKLCCNDHPGVRINMKEDEQDELKK